MNALGHVLPGCVEHQLELARPAPPLLAMGAWFKNALCGVKGGEGRMSRVVGDLNTPEACIAHEQEADTLLAWLGTPAAIAHDLHPDFHSSRHAAGIAARLGVTAVPVQHHHAHIAAVCAEHAECGPVIGLALDGVGLGTDNTPWGGELLKVEGARFERLGHRRRGQADQISGHVPRRNADAAQQV